MKLFCTPLYSLCSWRSQRALRIPPTPPQHNHTNLGLGLLASKMALLASKIASSRPLDAFFASKTHFLALETLFFRFMASNFDFFSILARSFMGQTLENINFT